MLSALLKEKRPSAELLGDVDVVLTATYVALGRGPADRSGRSEQGLAGLAHQADAGANRLRPRPLPPRRAVRRLDDADATRLPRVQGAAKAARALPNHHRQGRMAGASGGQGARARRLVLRRSPNGAARSAARGRVRSAEPTRRRTAPGLAGAVAQFQREHGIVVDSALGKETLSALNVPATYRLGQIAANMERYRWMPRALGDRYVFVNVPAFRLEAFDKGKETMEMKVIVGAEYENRNTPVFSDSMQYVVFRPYWNAPDEIAEKELWPKAETDPTYFERNDYEVVTEGGKQRVRQKPGDKNALGLVKFMFPNTFSIYMHDTPEHELFQKDVRAFSHGCIRLEQPDRMAQWVLGWSAEQVREAMESSRDDRHVNLKQKIPVYIVYFTTFMRDGRLQFGNDLYARDRALVESVKNGAQPTVSAVRAVRLLRELAED